MKIKTKSKQPKMKIQKHWLRMKIVKFMNQRKKWLKTCLNFGFRSNYHINIIFHKIRLITSRNNKI